MGQSESRHENIIGESSGERPDLLTEKDMELLEKRMPIFDYFYKEPTLENYRKIRDIDGQLTHALGSKYHLFLSTIREIYPSLGEPLNRLEKRWLKTSIEGLMYSINTTASDLDRLWILYYATGYKEFPAKIQSIIRDPNIHYVVRSAATWSYKSHVDKGQIPQNVSHNVKII
jgi:hypothetical protein